MSKEADQALTMLSIIAGAMEVMRIDNAFAKKELINPPERAEDYTPIEMTRVTERLVIDLPQR